MKNNLVCKLIGHKIDEQTNFGYYVCKRCGYNEYCDEMVPIYSIIRKFYQVKYYIQGKLSKPDPDGLPF